MDCGIWRWDSAANEIIRLSEVAGCLLATGGQVFVFDPKMGDGPLNYRGTTFDSYETQLLNWVCSNITPTDTPVAQQGLYTNPWTNSPQLTAANLQANHRTQVGTVTNTCNIQFLRNVEGYFERFNSAVETFLNLRNDRTLKSPSCK